MLTEFFRWPIDVGQKTAGLENAVLFMKVCREVDIKAYNCAGFDDASLNCSS
jgi:hypothetical protein